MYILATYQYFEFWKAHESWNYIKQTHNKQVTLRKQHKIWQHWANAKETTLRQRSKKYCSSSCCIACSEIQISLQTDVLERYMFQDNCELDICQLRQFLTRQLPTSSAGYTLLFFVPKLQSARLWSFNSSVLFRRKRPALIGTSQLTLCKNQCVSVDPPQQSSPARSKLTPAWAQFAAKRLKYKVSSHRPAQQR